MKASSLEIDLYPIRFFSSDSSAGVPHRIKGLLTRDHAHRDKLSDWQTIFFQSKVNGGLYGGEDLPQRNWEWPKNTWFQERLSHYLKNSGPSM